MAEYRRNCVTHLDEERIAKCLEEIFGREWKRQVSDNGTRVEGWSIILHESCCCDNFTLERLRLRFNTEFKAEFEKMDTNPLAYWILRRIGNGWIEVRYIIKGIYSNEPDEVKEMTRFYEDQNAAV